MNAHKSIMMRASLIRNTCVLKNLPCCLLLDIATNQTFWARTNEEKRKSCGFAMKRRSSGKEGKRTSLGVRIVDLSFKGIEPEYFRLTLS